MDVVQAKLRKIQLDYLEILKKIRKNTDFKILIDEINLYWFKNKKFILFLLNEYFCPYNTIMFTGATYLDCKQNEQFPFITCDGIHIVDDNVCSYGNIFNKIDDKVFNNSIKEQFIAAVEDNIFILENYSKYMYILPIHYLCDKSDYIFKSAEKIFLNMFQTNFDNLSEYFSKVQTISDLKEHLIPQIENSIIFYENDNKNLPLQKRIENYILYSKDTLDLTNKPASYIFFSSVFSHISQTLNIINICSIYQLIPYLRYNVAFLYFCNLIENFKDNDRINEMKNKTIACYLIYKSFNLEAVNATMFDNFISRVKGKAIYNKLYREISKNHESKINVCDIIGKLKQEISDLIKECN